MEIIDIIVLLITVAIAISVVIAAITPLILKTPMSEERSKILAGTAGALISIISMYIGYRIG